MNTEIKHKILEMRALDDRVRARLVQEGTLYDGYHPEMEAVHNQNAEGLEKIIDQIGWPTAELVGAEASNAAWIIAQHAISKPEFQRRCLALLKENAHQIPPAQVAALEDRILVFEGKPQIYGTNFDWDQNGEMNPSPIQNPQHVEELRKKMGLGTLAEATARIRKTIADENAKPPADLAKRSQEFLVWARRVGWRS